MARLTTMIQGSKPKTISSRPLSYSGRQPKAGGIHSCKRRRPSWPPPRRPQPIPGPWAGSLRPTCHRDAQPRTRAVRSPMCLPFLSLGAWLLPLPLSGMPGFPLPNPTFLQVLRHHLSQEALLDVTSLDRNSLCAPGAPSVHLQQRPPTRTYTGAQRPRPHSLGCEFCGLLSGLSLA